MTVPASIDNAPPATDWRRTGQPRLAPGRRIYAVGDIHGRADLLQVLVARILADLQRFPVATPELVFLGDYVSRGPASAEVLAFMVEGTAGLPLAVHTLKGNHEDLLLRFVDGHDLWAGAAWLRFGGKPVFASYGLTPPDELHDESKLIEAAQALAIAMPTGHLDFLRGLDVSLERDDYILVHGGLRPGIALADQTAHDKMWIRDEFLNHTGLFDRFVVHGHTATALPEIRPYRLNVDTRAYASGVLTAAVLEGAERRFLASL